MQGKPPSVSAFRRRVRGPRPALRAESQPFGIDPARNGTLAAPMTCRRIDDIRPSFFVDLKEDPYRLA
jgi:hypothetical protein